MGPKWEGNCNLWVLNEIIKKIYIESLKKIQPISTQVWLDWLCYLAGNSQMAPTIFFQIFRIYFFNYFIKNPQTTIALTFLTYVISATGGVSSSYLLRRPKRFKL
jgi:hypothetical protein